MIIRRPSGLVEPCQPSNVAKPTSGTLWVHEIKHDGCGLMVRRNGARVHEKRARLGRSLPAIVEAASRIQASSFLIDGEPAMTARRTSRAAKQSRGHKAMVFAFDLIEHDGIDLRVCR